MRQTVKELQGDVIMATDGHIGSVEDVYFDETDWAVRYLVVNTSDWLPGKRVLVSPAAIDAGASSDEQVRVRISREQVERAPDAINERPVSRQKEMAHAAHFGYPYYWGSSPELWGATGVPTRPPAGEPSVGASRPEAERAAQALLEQGDSHLRSGAEVIGYGIEARDGAIGDVQDFVVDEDTWAIDGVVVDTKKWWPGGLVQVRPRDVERIDWDEHKLHLRLTRDEVKRSGAARQT
jgi:sporulation protein YlmC with PRC-barrel domain